MKKFWKKAMRARDSKAGAASPITTPPLLSSTAPATSSSLTLKDTARTNASPVLAILKDGGEMLKDVPYLKAIAGILNTLFKIWEEIKNVDSLTEELLESVQRRSEKLVQTLEELAKQGGARLAELENDLKEYKDLLENIAKDLHTMQASGSIDRWLQRTESRDMIHRHMRRLAEFGETFSISRLTTLVTQVNTIVQWTSKHEAARLLDESTMFKDGQPPCPHLVLGRDSELGMMRDIFLKNSSPRLAILGPGGMGKTTVAQQLMNDEEVLTTFPTPLFVSCENLISTTAVLNAIADILHIPADHRGQTLQINVVKQLRSRPGCLLCLDNFEDAWDSPSTRRTIEDLLTVFDGIRSIGIIVTMRGTERPHGLNWTRPYPPSLEPLDDESARALFVATSNCTDEGVQVLLRAVDNIPLAIKLLGRLVEEDGLDYVLQQWRKEGLNVIDREDASDTRTTSVTASINLSLSSPRISSIQFLREVLTILAILPDGLSESMVDVLEANLPPGVDLRRILHALVRIALCYRDSHGRYRLLAPIRQHVQKALPLDPSFLHGVKSTFLKHVIGSENTSYHDTVTPEMSNIRLFVASESTAWDETRISACISYLWWENRILDIQDIPLALEALSHAHTPVLQVRCRLLTSQLLQFSFRHREAREYLIPALSIKTDPHLEGNVRLGMGDIERMLHKYEEAETFIRQAVSLFKEANQPDWEGFALERLGTLLRAWGRTSAAEVPLVRSLELARNAKDTLSEGNALCELGHVYRLMDRMSEAEDSLRQAIDCYRQSHSIRNEALAYQSLGMVHYDTGDLKESEKSLLTSRDLHVRINDRVGEADVLRWLGLVYSRMDGQLESAETHLKDAHLIFQQIPTTDNQAYVYEDLGNLYLQQGHSSKANTHWVVSIAFHLCRLHKSKWERVVPICSRIQQVSERRISVDTRS